MNTARLMRYSPLPSGLGMNMGFLAIWISNLIGLRARMRAAFDVLATADLVVAPQQASGPAQGGEVTCTGPAAHCGQAEEGGNRGHGSAHICWFETGAVMQRTHLQGLSSKC